MPFHRLKVESDEFLHLDAIRLFASLFVVFHHWKSALILPGMALAANSSVTTVFPRLQFLELSVDVFFVISGIIITRVYASRITDRTRYLQYLIRRVARIYPLHLVTLLLMAALFYRATSWKLLIPGNNTSISFFRNVFLVNSWWKFPLSFNIVAWSISVEWLCYLLFPLMLYLQRRNRWTWIAVCCVPLLVSIGPVHVATSLLRYRVLRGLLAFYIGTGLQLRHKEFLQGTGFIGRTTVLRSQRHIYGFATVLLLIAALLLSVIGVPEERLYVLAFALVFTAFLADIFKSSARFARHIAPLSQLTFSIYMWHIPFSVLFQVLMRHHTSAWVWNSLLPLFVVPLLLLSYGSFVVFEDPARKWLSNLAGRHSSANPIVREAEQLAP